MSFNLISLTDEMSVTTLQHAKQERIKHSGYIFYTTGSSFVHVVFVLPFTCVSHMVSLVGSEGSFSSTRQAGGAVQYNAAGAVQIL